MAAGATEIFGPLIYTVCLISNYSAVSYFRMESERLTTSTDVHIVEGKRLRERQRMRWDNCVMRDPETRGQKWRRRQETEGI